MRRFILSGAPGAGKTSTIEALRARGYAVIDEAATDVIAVEQARGVDEPWADPLFIDKITALQRSRQLTATGDLQFYDRSPVCTLALARYVRHPPSAALTAELARVLGAAIYEREVFFLRPLGFVEPTAARRISYADSLRFGQLHAQEYQRLGFRLVDIQPADPQARAAAICDYLKQEGAPPAAAPAVGRPGAGDPSARTS